MEIKEILKNRRIELGLTMLEVAKKVGVSEATISRWESGDIANMKRDKIVLLANALELSPSVIMGWEEKEEKKPSLFQRLPEYVRTAEEARRVNAMLPSFGSEGKTTEQLSDDELIEYVNDILEYIRFKQSKLNK